MQHLLLLHGAIGSKEQLQPLATLLTDHYHVHTLNFDGHGGAALPTGNFSIASFAGNVLAYMKEHGVSNAHVFGYSMGGYVGMYLAKHHPLSIKSLVTLATKYYWDPAVAANEVRMLDPDTIRQKVPIFAAQLEQRHAPVDWRVLLEKIKSLLLQLGNDSVIKETDYGSLSLPVLVMLGDRDKMVSLEETVNVYKNIPKAQLCILPGTPHPIEQSDMPVLASFIRRFCV